ncbi:MAG TPA: cytochrome c [Acidimicrobiia bacterium]|nr:cytochrome c [Acidimicrobiia bacterium]
MRRAATRATSIALLGLGLVFVFGGTSLAQTDQPTDQVIAEGRVVFEANCAACHQADGKGLAGIFPPLAGNEAVMDSQLVRDVLANGKTGELVVNGVTYDSVMPPFAALTEDQVTSVIAYVQYGLDAPTGATTTVAATGSTDSGSSGSNVLRLLLTVAGVAFLGAAGWVLRPVAASHRAGDGTGFATDQVWVKTLIIVLFFVAFTVWLPSMIIKWGALSSLPSLLRDLIGLAVWFVALAGGMYLLRRAQRSRII